MRKHHYRIVKPVRFFIFVLITTMVIVFAGYSLFSASHAEAADTTVTYAQVVIQDGDTLWDIAGSYNPEKTDLRPVIHDIYDINGISDGEIHPGDVLLIPVY